MIYNISNLKDQNKREKLEAISDISDAHTSFLNDKQQLTESHNDEVADIQQQHSSQIKNQQEKYNSKTAIIDEHGNNNTQAERKRSQLVAQNNGGTNHQANEKKAENDKALSTSVPNVSPIKLSSNGVYSEKLKTGGELKVDAKGWLIQYYFPGPDRRYNGTFVKINGQDINKYIKAWRANYRKYSDLKKEIPEGGTYQVDGEMYMKIYIGGPFDGVCLRSYHMCTRTSDKIEAIIRDYEYALTRATQIQKSSI